MNCQSDPPSTWISACFEKEIFKAVPNMSCTFRNRIKESEDWLDKFSPKIPSELFLQKQKLDLINNWLQEANAFSTLARILIITGPCGSGRTTALRVLASAQDIEVIEWSTPPDIESFEHGYGGSVQSASNKFEAFLMNAGRYVSVLCGVKCIKKLILVKDIPNVFILKPSLLHEVLRKYHQMGRIPVVFSISEQMEGRNKMFPKLFIEELLIQQISFNKVPNKSILRTLKRISSLKEGSVKPSDEVMEDITANSQGDIRNAVLQLSYEFSHHEHTRIGVVMESVRTSKTLKHTSKKKKKINKIDGLEQVGSKGRDMQIPIFQRVGRLLYPKKSADDPKELTHNPDEIVEQSVSSPQRFVHMVHENYLKIFQDMDSAYRAIRYASDTDSMMSEFRERDLTLPMALSTIARGFMTCSTTAKRKWTPLTNQENAAINKRKQALRELVISMNLKYLLIPRDASMDILPITCPEYFLRSNLKVSADLSSASDEDDMFLLESDKKIKEGNIKLEESVNGNRLQVKTSGTDKRKRVHVQDDDDYVIEETDSD